jgi:hypothetical protein
MSARSRRVVLSDELDREDGEGTVEFRLTCDGPLLSGSGGRDTEPTRRGYKQGVRKRLHSRLRRLWEAVPHLKAGRRADGVSDIVGSEYVDDKYDVATLASKHSLMGGVSCPW